MWWKAGGKKKKTLSVPSVLCSQSSWLTRSVSSQLSRSPLSFALPLAKYCFGLERHFFRVRGAHPRFARLFMFPLFICMLFIWGNWERNACLFLFLSLEQMERFRVQAEKYPPNCPLWSLGILLSPTLGTVSMRTAGRFPFIFFPKREINCCWGSLRSSVRLVTFVLGAIWSSRPFKKREAALPVQWNNKLDLHDQSRNSVCAPACGG